MDNVQVTGISIEKIAAKRKETKLKQMSNILLHRKGETSINLVHLYQDTTYIKTDDSHTDSLTETMYYFYCYKTVPKLSIHFSKDKDSIKSVSNRNARLHFSKTKMQTINLNELIRENEILTFTDLLDKAVLRCEAEPKKSTKLSDLLHFKAHFNVKLFTLEFSRQLSADFTFCENFCITIRLKEAADLVDSFEKLEKDINALNSASLVPLNVDFALDHFIARFLTNDINADEFSEKTKRPRFLFGFWENGHNTGPIRHWIDRSQTIKNLERCKKNKRLNLIQFVEVIMHKKVRLDSLGIYYRNNIQPESSELKGVLTFFDAPSNWNEPHTVPTMSENMFCESPTYSSTHINWNSETLTYDTSSEQPTPKPKLTGYIERA